MVHRFVNAKADVESCQTIDILQDWDLKANFTIHVLQVSLHPIFCDIKQVLTDKVSVGLMTRLAIVASIFSQHMQDAFTVGQYVESKLELLYVVNFPQVKIVHFNGFVHDEPVKLSEGFLNQKLAVDFVPVLQVIDAVDLLKYAKLVLFES